MNFDKFFESLKNDIENEAKRQADIAEACGAVYELFTELTGAGFTDTQAFQMIGLLLTINK